MWWWNPGWIRLLFLESSPSLTTFMVNQHTAKSQIVQKHAMVWFDLLYMWRLKLNGYWEFWRLKLNGYWKFWRKGIIIDLDPLLRCRYCWINPKIKCVILLDHWINPTGEIFATMYYIYRNIWSQLYLSISLRNCLVYLFIYFWLTIVLYIRERKIVY